MKLFRTEYPRPEFVREKWISLNGEWDFEFDFGNSGIRIGDFGNAKLINYRNREMLEKKFSRKINVPFCPESDLSGIGYKDFINACWYKKEVEIPTSWKGRIILHFEAAYYETLVFIGEKFICKHEGGYTPFSCDVTDYIEDNKATILVHCAGDPRNGREPSGKQSISYESHGCFYTRTTGIWQSVWLEAVPDDYLEKVFITPDIDNEVANVKLFFNNVSDKKIRLTALYDNVTVSEKNCVSTGKYLETQMEIKNPKLWEIGNGRLYDLKIEVESDSGTDEISSYFGMRKVEVDDKGMLLNGKRVMQKLVLDQGYYKDGIYTAQVADDLKKDIELSMSVGFNGARLHQKVFERRFLYECDKAGYIVWGEYPSWNFDYSGREAFLNFLPEWMEAVERDYNHPAIITWCPLNENFPYDNKSQCDDFVKQLYLETKRFDSTRPVVDVSWFTHVKTDFFDSHDYVQEIADFEKAYGSWKEGEAYDNLKQKYNGEPYVLSEFGGFQWPVKEGGWGYGAAPKTEDEYEDRFTSFIKILMNNPRICGFCYTQLYDVETEQNGIYYYSRERKFDNDRMERLKKALDGKSKYEELK